MTPERWQRAKEIFQAALDRAPDERSAFLASACDEALRKEVESLIASHEKSGEFIDSPAYEAATELFKADQDLKPGQAVGHYEILSTLGRGGMGEVYLARDSKLGRKLALKFLPSEFTKNAERLCGSSRGAQCLPGVTHPQECFAPLELRTIFGPSFYRHSIPTGFATLMDLSNLPITTAKNL